MKDMFALPESGVYLDGNSLGPMPRSVPHATTTMLRQWQDHLIAGWLSDGWYDAPQRVGDAVGELIGAGPGQVCCGESTTVSLFNALVAARALRPNRSRLLVDADHFPTDLYMASSAAHRSQATVTAVPATHLYEALRRHGSDVAAVFAAPVDFRTGERRPLAELTRAAHDHGALAVWDLSHAAGAYPLAVDVSGVDFAVGCGYKYLCGGPGAPAWSYVARRHHTAVAAPLAGWHAHRDPFAMESAFEPAAGIARMRTGTPQMLSLGALEVAVATIATIGVDEIRTRTVALTERFLRDARQVLALGGFELASPADPERRGNHIVLRHPAARAIAAALEARNVVCDVRGGDLLRMCFSGAFLDTTDVARTVAALGAVMDREEHCHVEVERSAVLT